jgi:hypothetical protein
MAPRLAEPVAAPDRALAYRDELAGAARRAMAEAPASVHDLRLGGAHVRLRLAGPALEPALLPALAHGLIERTSALPELTIDAWDTESTGVGPPAFPWRPEDVRERGEIRGFNDGAVRTLYHAGGPGTGRNFQAISVVDTARGAAWFVVASEQCVPWYERAAPLRAVLHLGLQRSTRLLVHAAALGHGSAGMLLAGAAGSGKSTTAMACVLAGLDYAGDDYVVVDVGEDPLRAHSLYGTAKFDTTTTTLLPELAAHVPAGAGRDGEKLVLDLAGTWPRQMRAAVALSAIVVPSVRPGLAQPRLTRCSPAQALRALAPTTIHQLPSVGGATLAPLAALVRRVPAYALELGGPPQAAATALISLLEELDGSV